MSTENQFAYENFLKDIAISFLQLVASGSVREAYENYIDTTFRHHNPYFPDDAPSLLNAMEEDARQNPEKKLEVKLAIQEGNSVAVHSHVKQNPEDPGWAIIHIFRFERNKIVELWDVGQAVPEDSPNYSSMF